MFAFLYKGFDNKKFSYVQLRPNVTGDTTQTDKTKYNDQILHDSQAVIGGQILDSIDMTDNDSLAYDWEHCENLQAAKAFTTSDYGTKSDYNQTSDDEFMVPDPSLSGIAESTVTKKSSSKPSTDVEEKYLDDDMSILTDISNIKVSNAPQKHEYGKEKIERKGNISDKLYNAALKGELTIVKDILEHHDATVMLDKNGQTPLYAACIGNHLAIISLLINSGFDVNHQDNEGKTVLHIAFENHVPDLAQTLITEFGVDSSIRDTHNWTPLHTAIDRGYCSYSKELSEKFLQLDAGNEVSWIQLQAACFEENYQDVQFLLNSNIDVNHVSSSGYTALHIAVTKSNIDIVTRLLDQGVNVHSVTTDGKTPLHIAADNGANAIIQKLLMQKANPSLKDVLGNTSLHLAVQLKQETKSGLVNPRAHCCACSAKTIKAIIKWSADVNAVNSRGQTALWFACIDGQETFVKILLDAGADPNITDNLKDSSLHAAINGCCNIGTVKEIIDHGAHVNAVNNMSETPLLLACSTAQAESVKLLLEAGADPNITTIDEDTSLHSAIAQECTRETLQEIIDHGANVNAVNKTGRTALLLSCCYGQMDSVKVLLQARADPTIADEELFSCLHAAVDGRCSKDTLNALIDHGAPIDARREDGTNALLSACRTGQSESLKFLLEAGADESVVKPDGNTILHEAVKGKCSNESLQKIIDHGVVNINYVNNHSQTALLSACYTAQAESIKVLLENGADPNISDVNDYTSLHAAVGGCCTKETLQQIMSKMTKADLDARNIDGETALLLACSSRKQDLIKTLLEAGSNPMIESFNNLTCLYAAVNAGCKKDIIQAITNGAFVDTANNDLETALMIACGKGDATAVNVLLKAGANTNKKNCNGDTCLHYSVHGVCSKEVLRVIVESGADVNAKNRNGITALMTASRWGNIDAITVLLHAGADPNIIDGNGDTCLHKAVDGDCSKEVLQAIVESGVDVNITNKKRVTALMKASRRGNVDAITVLLHAGADPNTLDDYGNTLLHYAGDGDCSKETLQVIVESGVDVNATNRDGITALMVASTHGNIDAIIVLLHAGAETSIVDCDCDTLLHYAVCGDYSKEALQAIVESGVDVNATNNNRITALMVASTHGNIDAISTLLCAGADPNIIDVDGNTLLRYAVDGDCSKEVLQAIVESGVDVNITNKNGVTALMKAFRRGNIDAISVLLHAGADRNSVDGNGNTLFHYAVDGNCSKETLQAIVESGIDVNATNKNGVTPLMKASRRGNIDAISVLLHAGADPNIIDGNGNTLLHYAVYVYCRKEVLQEIVESGVDVNATNRNGITALMKASRRGHIDAISVLLHAGVDPNIVDCNGNTLLHYAVDGECSKEVLQAIVESGIDVNATNKNGVTPLMKASRRGNIDAISVLLHAGADPNIIDGNGNTLLHYAVYVYCRKEVLQEIVESGVDVNATNRNGITALMKASRRGHIDAISVLLHAGVDPNIVDCNGNTLLHYAVYGDCSMEVLQAIVESGVDVNATNRDKITVLMVASTHRNRDAIFVLLHAGVDPNIVDGNGNTLLHYAVDGDYSKEVLQSIVESGIDVNATNKNGITALMMASRRGNIDAISVLLHAGADPNIVDGDGNTLLHYAVYVDCSKDVLQAIVHSCIDVNTTNRDGITALMTASRWGNIDAISVLLHAGVDPNIVDCNGNTLLHYAVDGDYSKEVLQTIVESGVDVNATNWDGITVLMLASTHGNRDAISVLLHVGADPNIIDVDGNTFLHKALEVDCSKEVLQAIVESGVDVNATNKNGITALMTAYRRGNIDAMSVLLHVGGDPNIVDGNGDTLLRYAVHGHCSKEVLQAIVESGIDVNATNKNGTSALMIASRRGNIDAISVLLHVGADRNSVDGNGDTLLHYAVDGECSKEVLQAIVESGIDVNATNKNGTTALMKASRRGNIDAISVLLRAGVDPNIVDGNGNTLLHYAVDGECSKEVLQAIVESGIDVNATNKNGTTALMMASGRGNIDAMSVLLHVGGDPNIVDGNGDTLLRYAVHGPCSKEVLQAIVESGIDVNATNKNGTSALMIASRRGNIDAISVLLHVGADRNSVDGNGNTLLHYAVYGDCSKEVLQAIVESGIDVNATNKNGITALMKASRRGNIDAISVLLHAGVDTNIVDGNGNTLLHYAAYVNCSKEVLQAIVESGVDVNATNRNEITALMTASRRGNIDAISVLLHAGVDPNAVNGNGNTLLHYAVDGDCTKEVLQAIVESGIDVKATNRNGITALMTASRRGNIDAISVLLHAGADPNIVDGNGNTLLHYAVDGDCRKEVLQAIVESGIDVNATNRNGITVLMVASTHGNIDAISELLHAGADPNIIDVDGNTFLHKALDVDCSKEVLQAIVESGVDVNATNKNGITPLMKASRRGNRDAISVLLHAGADPNIVDGNGDTLLRYGVHGHCSKETLQAIVESGVDVNATNKNGITALMKASRRGNIDAISVLLHAGADPNIVDGDGDTLLRYAVDGDCSKEVLQAIVESGIDVNATNKNGITALMKASRRGNIDAIAILLHAGADPNIIDADGNTCLHKAVDGECSKEAFKAIVESSIDVNATNKNRITALMTASRQGNIDAISVLLHTGADPNIVDGDGNTLLHYAIHGDCSKEVLQAIVESGVDVNATNKNGITAFMMASRMGNTDATSVLLRAGAAPFVV